MRHPEATCFSSPKDLGAPRESSAFFADEKNARLARFLIGLAGHFRGRLRQQRGLPHNIFQLPPLQLRQRTRLLNPHEVAYYDPEGSPTAGEAWSSYWYNGKIYTNDIRRGQDVYDFILPSNVYGATFGHLNAQTQEDLLPPIAPLPALTSLITARQGALTGRLARQGHRGLVTARARGWLLRARG